MNDLFYHSARALLKWTIRLYYRRVEVSGRELIPAVGPAILVANHPNSVVDAFLLCTQLTRRKVNFIAKDSITGAPVVGWLARRFGVVGVARAMDYQRQRDLAHDRNKAAIAACVPRLLVGEILTIFGEGISTDARHLQMIRKGAMRFGFSAEQAACFQLGLVWIPVGITYSAKQRFRSDVFVCVGQPFRIADLHADPAGHQQKVLQLGTERLQRELESLVINIKREELGQLIDRLTELTTAPAGSLAARWACQRRVAGAVQYFNTVGPHRLAELEQSVRRYYDQVGAAGLTDAVVRQRHPGFTLRASLLGALKGCPLMVLGLYGGVNSFVPRWAARLARPLGRSHLASAAPGGPRQVRLTKQALSASVGAWAAAALSFPLQIYLVFRWFENSLGFPASLAIATLYGLSLIPSWHFYARRRDLLRLQLANTRDALLFLLHGRQSLRLRARRRRLQRRTRALLAAYDSAAPAGRKN